MNVMWKRLVKEHNAVLLTDRPLIEASKRSDPTRPIAFETLNFGWILSAKDENGFRRILVKY